MKAPPISYVRPRSLNEVFELLDQHGEHAKLLAGGQSLMPTLNMRLASPRLLIDISRLGTFAGELAGIRVSDRHVHIGALTTHSEIGASADIRRHLPLLSDAAPFIAHPAIRNAGTLGGSLAMADPAAEWPACCVALDAQLVLASRATTRRVPAREFFQALYTTALKPNEIITEVVIPLPAPNTRHAFLELARRRGDYAIVGLAALAQVTHGTFAELQLVFLGAGVMPALAKDTSQIIVSKGFSESSLSEAQQALAGELSPTGDLYASPATKLHLARVLTARALQQLAAWPQ